MSPSPSSCHQSVSAEQARWFVEEVHAHDAALKTYLRSSFPAIRDVDDIAQESYLRIWKHRAIDPIRSAKAFLFKVAQHLALDTVRRQRRSPLENVGDLTSLGAFDQAPGAEDILTREESTQLLIQAIDALPGRCRQVVILRKLKLLSQRETAAILGISQKGVDIQLARALDRCREFFRRRDVNQFLRHGS